MAFYTPDWVRKLLKEEANEIASYVSKTRIKNGSKEFVADFRSYVDDKMPFVLFLDIDEIEQKVIVPNSGLLSSYIKHAFPNDVEKHLQLTEWFTLLLLSCYKQVINEFIKDKTYNDISSEQLEALLLGLNDAPGIRDYLNTHFTKKYRITNITKNSKSVLLLTPSFTSLSNFGTRFSAVLADELKKLDKDTPYIQTDSGDIIDNPYYVLRNAIGDKTGIVTGKKQQFTTQLHNIGHVEVDVVSDIDKTVKRGQLSPRFIQALATVPKTATEKLSVSFSKETGQADTRVLIRKKFSGRKMVFEMLVEYGFPVGIPESQLTNLQKASKELGFATGKSLTDAIRKNPSLLVDLETSKSINQYLVENVLSLIDKGKPTKNYTSEFTDTKKATYTKTKVVSAKLPKKTSTPKKHNTSPLRNLKGQFTSLISLQNLLNQRLHQQIRENMGTGASNSLLNYRSGRFAESAKVERLSQSKQGMLTAFYTYMKYPYATFSEGGLQQNPRSRDPKLLISKSIREIAGTTISNRMRAVNI